MSSSGQHKLVGLHRQFRSNTPACPVRHAARLCPHLHTHRRRLRTAQAWAARATSFPPSSRATPASWALRPRALSLARPASPPSRTCSTKPASHPGRSITSSPTPACCESRRFAGLLAVASAGCFVRRGDCACRVVPRSLGACKEALLGASSMHALALTCCSCLLRAVICSNPTPSMSAAVMNHFKMPSTTINFSLGGMGCR